MGFALSILYFITSYLGPSTIFGPLAAYNVEMISASSDAPVPSQTDQADSNSHAPDQGELKDARTQ